MARKKIIEVMAYGLEVGKLGYDIDKGRSYFQYNPAFLASGQYSKLFPFIFKRIPSTQVFAEYQQNTFQGLTVAEEFAIKNPKGILAEIQALIPRWQEIASNLRLPNDIIKKINQDLYRF